MHKSYMTLQKGYDAIKSEIGSGSVLHSSTVPQYKRAPIICTNHLDMVHVSYAAVLQWYIPICSFMHLDIVDIYSYVPIIYSNMLFMHLDIYSSAGQYGADRKKRGCRHSRLRRDCRQLFHRDLNSRVTIIASQSSWLLYCTVLLYSCTHSPPASSQLTHHAHHTRGQLRIKHHNNYTVWHQRGGDRIKTTITWMSDYRHLSTLCLIQTPIPWVL